MFICIDYVYPHSFMFYKFI